ncbi:MAG: hypothetical protein A2Y38_03075 [Spirochaetes bacterium GWB1_59_5]|nr:MAG: hypothetical protein A2Y38_03075 [Spirochaetes bacterium GWB1_59_5]
MSLLRSSSIFVLKTIACAAFACGAFFATLSLWGLVAAPFVRLESASFLIICALAVSAFATVAAYGALNRWLSRGKGLRGRR